jgi:branched-chain amino acid transport system ATP-binding protein
VLEIEELCVYYGDYQALFDVSLRVKPGEIISFLGANGAGKTTTINTISGVIRAKTGSVRFDGSEIHEWPAHRIVERGLTQIPEERMLFPGMTVVENLQMGAYLGRARQKQRDSLKWVYGLFPVLEERGSQLAGTLSGGEQQMLAIGRGLMSRPKLLMLDEPSLGLAPLLVLEVFRAIQEINQHAVDILLVEQNVHQSLRVSHRAYVLENGSVALEGETSKLLKTDYIRQSYLGV